MLNANVRRCRGSRSDENIHLELACFTGETIRQNNKNRTPRGTFDDPRPRDGANGE